MRTANKKDSTNIMMEAQATTLSSLARSHKIAKQQANKPTLKKKIRTANKKASTNIMTEEQATTLSSLEIEVTILQGRNLVAKDRALFGLGKKTASDPFVKVYLGGKKRGQTETIHKTLDPTWRRGRIKIKLNSHDANAVISGKDSSLSSLKLCIFDEDKLSDNDPMGTVVIPLGPILTKKPTEKWYPVGKGSGQHHCHNATGDLKVKVAASGKKVLNQHPSQSMTRNYIPKMTAVVVLAIMMIIMACTQRFNPSSFLARILPIESSRVYNGVSMGALLMVSTFFISNK